MNIFDDVLFDWTAICMLWTLALLVLTAALWQSAKSFEQSRHRFKRWAQRELERHFRERL
jgi:CHASE1-domain containing sensor protein